LARVAPNIKQFRISARIAIFLIVSSFEFRLYFCRGIYLAWGRNSAM
jgi:hypothetical protein